MSSGAGDELSLSAKARLFAQRFQVDSNRILGASKRFRTQRRDWLDEYRAAWFKPTGAVRSAMIWEALEGLCAVYLNEGAL